MMDFLSTFPTRWYLLLFLPWAGLVACAAWCVRRGTTKRFLPCVVLVWLATSVALAWEARSFHEVLVLATWALLLWVLPQAGILALQIRRRQRPLAMLAATLLLWIVQLPASIMALMLAGCVFLQQCL